MLRSNRKPGSSHAPASGASEWVARNPCFPSIPSSADVNPRSASPAASTPFAAAIPQRLAHRPELRLEPRGARRDQPERVPHAALVEAVEPPCRDRGAEGPRRRRLMEPALVVRAAEPHADADRGLGADDEGVAHRRRRGSRLLADRKRGRIDADRQVPDMPEMRVVVVERMGDRAVRQRRRPRRHLIPAAARERRGRPPAIVRDVPPDDAAQRLPGARQRDRDPVAERERRHPPRRRRDPLRRQRRQRQHVLDDAAHATLAASTRATMPGNASKASKAWACGMSSAGPRRYPPVKSAKGTPAAAAVAPSTSLSPT